ncbi:acrosin-binding protein [Varanus komodoensis]|uniref:acrosin-binding protein n=1 Tax=Varanus komodoensis TaxID=61221 RepID=UPI001CF7B195|nr:acrosin-binding protein [Varanus komodoensis]
MQLFPSTLSSKPGSPLTMEEYKVFFSSLRPTWKATLVCQIRRNKGCHNLQIMQLDQYENHGQIPEGPICADLPEVSHFETFCLFAQFRCLNQKFYTKRIHCPNEPLVEETDVLPSPPSTKHSAAPTEVSLPSPDNRLRSSIEAILKYSFAVSGQDPMPRSHFPASHNDWEILQTPEQPDHSNAEHTTSNSETSALDAKKLKATERIKDQYLHQSINHLISTAFSLEHLLNSKNTEAAGDTESDLNAQEEISGTNFKGSLLDLSKDEALVILCYAVLQDICLSSAVSKAWKEVEANTLGYGDLICDNLGRRHTDLCPECAFCSLKMEQCQGASDLRRIHCGDGIFTNYINPGILAQHQAMDLLDSPVTGEYYGTETYGGLRAEYWCGRLATHGCDDFRVALWLQSEYSLFQGGDFPDKICDSTGVQHPTYCAFKSNQCLTYNLSNKKVLRAGCLRNETYQVLSKEEGEDEVLLWSQKFLSFGDG